MSLSTAQNILSATRTQNFASSHGRNRSLIGQTIKITQGHYKGSIGIVKDATETTARVELHSSCQTISVDTSRIQVIGGPSGKTGNITTYSRTPSYGGASGAATPLYRLDGSRTPMHDGSRTPHYGGAGGQTPMQDGSRTPAWDPSATQTPRHDPDGSGSASGPGDPSYFDQAYQPATPGGYSTAPYTPQTPGAGGGYGSEHTFSPFQPSPFNHPTPSPLGGYLDQSPGGMGAYQVTPSPGYSQSPLVYGQSPLTPSGTNFNPQTPGSGKMEGGGEKAILNSYH